jgi:response regulator of citrate/malate metabolism
MLKYLNDKGFKCKTADTATGGIFLIEEAITNKLRFDIIFVDMFLNNNETALDFLKTRKEKNLDTNEIGIVIIMASSEEQELLKECYKYNIQNFIAKPISKKIIEELM